MDSSIYSRVKKIMDEKSITIQELTQKSGLAHTTIIRSRTDSGIRGCSLATLETIARALEVKVDDLYTDSHDSVP